MVTRKGKGKERQQRSDVALEKGFGNSVYSFCDEHTSFLVMAVILLAFIVRVAALLSLKESIYFDYLIFDERLYHSWAEKIVNGTYKSSSVFEFAPFPAYLIALIYKIFSVNSVYIRILHLIFGVLTCYLVYCIGRELANRVTGLAACFIAALYKPFILYSIVPLKTALSVLLFAISIYLLVVLLNRHSLVKVLFLGIAISLLHYVRPNFLVVIPLLPLFILWERYKRTSSVKAVTAALVVYIVGVVIPSAPFMVRNYVVSGEAASTTSQIGFNLYMCNSIEYSYPLPFASTVPSIQGIHFTIEASRRVGRKLTPREASSYWTGEVIRGALAAPGAFAGKILRKTVGFFSQYKTGDHYELIFLSKIVAFFKLPLFGLWLVLPFGMAGMCLNMFRSTKNMALSAVFFFYASTLVIFFTSIRLRTPLLIILIPFAVIGIGTLVSFYRAGAYKKVYLYAFFVLLFFLIEYIPLEYRNMTGHYNTYAIILSSKGREEEAIRYWEKSSQENRGFSDFANLSLARRYYRMNKPQKVGYYLEKISDSSYAAARKYEMIGDIMMNQLRTDEAISAYRKALEINSGLRNTRRKLIRALEKVDSAAAAEESKKLEYILSFYNLF